MVSYDDLKEENIEANVNVDEIKANIGIGGRDFFVILDDECKNFSSRDNAIPDGLAGEIVTLSNDNSRNDIITDDYGNIRYIGKNPNNYVTFNNEEWRIIGIVDGYVKIVKTVSLGGMDWTDAGRYSDLSNNNDWTTSKIKEYLNGEYYYNMTKASKKLIENFMWKLGGIGPNTNSNWYPLNMYKSERGVDVYPGRPTEWAGYIGLMYPSDYGFSTSGGATTSRTNCYRISIIDWQKSSYLDCKNNSWIFDNDNVWLLSPFSQNNYSVFLIGKFGQVGVNSNINTNGIDYFSGHQVKPAVYLKKSARIISGDGSKENPFVIG